MPLEWVTRESWKAVPARRCVSITPPVKNVFFTIANTSMCRSNEECGREMRILQDQHMRKQGMEDIRYSFTIGGNGQFFEGRGWLTRTVLDPDCQDLQNDSLIIAYLGPYTQNTLPKLMKTFGQELLVYGVLQKFIAEDFKSHNLTESENSIYKESYS